MCLSILYYTNNKCPFNILLSLLHYQCEHGQTNISFVIVLSFSVILFVILIQNKLQITNYKYFITSNLTKYIIKCLKINNKYNFFYKQISLGILILLDTSSFQNQF